MTFVHPVVTDYLLEHCPEPDDLLRDLEAETRTYAPNLASSHYESRLLMLLARMLGARRGLVLGVFTGYSTLCMARGMAPDDGSVIGCELRPEWAEIARRHFEKAGLADRIDLRVEPAGDTLAALDDEATLDIAHIGADKAGAPAYFEALLPRMRPGGVIILGDALRSARVLEQDCREPEACVMRNLNDLITSDDRVESIILPVGDGATLIRKR